ncbi:NAD+ synthase (glutamine-hydrolyzing) [Neorhizobium huautlense]|uniref:Glutamine-dependent NAD(+) synthetase n=1 Tax=Neorhizobium huautlense TaxID=67774 RepID=A0ABT9PZ27_9HYPH|nr:NAD(+) synthase [Neorhizobium huautlense]MDP9839692.1 NAD+ synthase (glutamine-hydrolyzing) [Neorhizobium huautlense]
MNFHSAYAHGFVRVATATPACEIGDPAFNAKAVLELARQGHDQGVALMVFPELGISGYSIDDLLGQAALLDAVETALKVLVEASRDLIPVLLVGAPLRHRGRLFNCAIVIHAGKILGVVPKAHLPNYREFYEKRWFASGRTVRGQEIAVAGQVVPFGIDLLFEDKAIADFVFHVEICEDVWVPAPPSDFGALAGATILANLSASNVTVGKADVRKQLCANQSSRNIAAYLYSAAGPGESTTDLAWDGQACIYELGNLLAETERFPEGSQMCVADIDVERLALERLRTVTFEDAAERVLRADQPFRRIGFEFAAPEGDIGLKRSVARYPFVPSDPARLDQDCYETFNIQVQGLMKRLKATGIKRLCIGISGGLDSTHALLVAARAFDRLGWPRTDILGFTMPGFATGDETLGNAWSLMRSIGITAEEVDIKPLALQLLKDLGHPFSGGEPVYDVTFENVQAGLRTDFLFRAANQRNAIVLGTGDLSEIGLGWCTYGVGDQMSHYNVNGSVSKTLIQHLIRWVINSGSFDAEANATLERVLGTIISPELVPAGEDGVIQSTEDKIGPYDLHDFTLYYLTRYGLKPSKIAYLAHHAWKDVTAGAWPPNFPDEKRREYDLSTIRKWLQTFLFRFFTISQFKRSASPNGPKVTSGGSLSPRGDWRAPSDGNARVWLRELEENVPEA